MIVRHSLPKGAVLSWSLPKGQTFQKSTLVEGALVHTFVFCNGGVSVPIHLHVKVGTTARIHETTHWCVKALNKQEDQLDLLLTPAPADAPATISSDDLHISKRDHGMVLVAFEGVAARDRAKPKLTSVDRRLRLAEQERMRAFG